MATNLAQAIEVLEKGKRGGALSIEDLYQLDAVILAMSQRIHDYEQIAIEDQRMMKKATIAFKRAKGWPAQMMPLLSDLLDWLMDKATVKKSLYYENVLGRLLEKIDDLGPFNVAEEYRISGAWLLGLRQNIAVALARGTGRPEAPSLLTNEEKDLLV